MILDGNAAYVGKALVDLPVAAVGRKDSEADRRSVVDQLQRGLLRKSDLLKIRDSLTAIAPRLG